jgi:16S rRNA (guanine(966)-N(2))-methyltransferase RsmD
MKYQVRIIAGSLRGRKLTLVYHPHLRPLADRAREALFSILGDAVPDRPFVDVFAGSGAVGIEALSRGARQALFVERDLPAVKAIQEHLARFEIAGKAQVLRADAYRWAGSWQPPAEPVNVFVGPPYREFADNVDAVSTLISTLQARLAPGSVLVVQSDELFDPELLPEPGQWDVRCYGRTQLAVWVSPQAKTASPAAEEKEPFMESPSP